MMQGINIHRVHDVKEVRQAIDIFEKLNENEKSISTDGIRGEVGTFPIIESFFKLAISLTQSKKKLKK